MASEWLKFDEAEIDDLTDVELVEFDRLVRARDNQLTRNQNPEEVFECFSWNFDPVNSWVAWKGSGARPTLESILAESRGRRPTDLEIQVAKSCAMSMLLDREKARRVRERLQAARLSLGLTHQDIASVTGLEPTLIAEIEQGRAWSPRPDLFEPTCSIEGEKEARHLSRTPWMPLADLRLCRTIRKAKVDASWLSAQDGAALSQARSIREGCAFDRLPELGEILEAAGCDDREILDHCRKPGLHATGCWVVDALVRAGRAV
jgi:transcriptional regulator with XRE-family HTH domain